MTILCDVDDVVADLRSAWLRRHNVMTGSNFTVEDLTDWNIGAVVGEDIYDHLEDPSLYDEVAPVPYAEEGISELRKMGHRVVFVTSCNAATVGAKMEWLNYHGFTDHLGFNRDIIIATDKSLVQGDMMIEDYHMNLLHWKMAHPDGVGVLMDAPYNRSFGMIGTHRATGWPEIVSVVEARTELVGP